MGSERADDAHRVPRPARPPEPARSANPLAREAEAKPTPVRDGVAPPTPEEGQATSDREVASRSLVVDGVTWSVRVWGRGRAGTDTSHAPLLVLGFFRDPDAEVPEREAVVVGRSLDELTARQLEGALAVSGPPPEPGRRKELFPETATKGRKGDR